MPLAPGTVVVWLALGVAVHAQQARPVYRPAPQQGQQAKLRPLPGQLRYQSLQSSPQIHTEPAQLHTQLPQHPRVPQSRPQLIRQATGSVKYDSLLASSQPLRQVALPPKYDGLLSTGQLLHQPAVSAKYNPLLASPQSLRQPAGPLKYDSQYAPAQLLQQSVVSPKYEIASDDHFPGGFQRYQYASRPVDVGYTPSFARKTPYYRQHYSPSGEYYQKPHYSYAPDQEMLEVQKEVLELVEPLHKEDGMFPQKNRSSMYALLVPLMLLGISIPAIGFMYTYLNRRRSFGRSYTDADACSLLPSDEILDCYMKIFQRSLECFHKKCE
ncbi:uncharacterized protein LOC124556589 [Schistocerca americana]|uniref:uncharacterized protein LOC124556589 n=1 Tax=Schistocerca americana TaxID=7009 RepID=UPI001F4F8B39|nr:uncharacterized protein LOC124556589 [Schistocerca americana]XP_049955731.1 uncharacterized protein LOC126471547 [Schistocerca serialis cubense]